MIDSVGAGIMKRRIKDICTRVRGFNVYGGVCVVMMNFRVYFFRAAQEQDNTIFPYLYYFALVNS